MGSFKEAVAIKV